MKVQLYRITLLLAIVCVAVSCDEFQSESTYYGSGIGISNERVLSLGIFNKSTLTYCYLTDSTQIKSLLVVKDGATATIDDKTYTVTSSPIFHPDDEIYLCLFATVYSLNGAVSSTAFIKFFDDSIPLTIRSDVSIISSTYLDLTSAGSGSFNFSSSEYKNTIKEVYVATYKIPHMRDGRYMVTCVLNLADEIVNSGFGYINVVPNA